MTLFPSLGILGIPGPADSSWFRLPQEGGCFDGHFDGHPILPGVAHFALVLTACAHRSSANRALLAVRDVKFTRPLLPGDEIEVVLAEVGEPCSTRFEIRCRGERASSGLLVFANGDTHPS